jgi:uncharacterized membrane protein YeiH
MALTLAQEAHTLWLGLELLGTMAFALSAAVAAQRRGNDVFGVAALGAGVGVAGSTLRDVLLHHPPLWVRMPSLVAVAALTALASALLTRAELLGRWQLYRWADAVGLAALSVGAADLRLSEGGDALGAVALGLASGLAPGVLRDALLHRKLLVLREEFYVTAGLLGTSLHVFFSHTPVGGARTFWLSVLTVIALRAVGMRGGWSFPLPRRGARGSSGTEPVSEGPRNPP